MAATAVYIDIVRIPGSGGMQDDSKSFANINATTASFKLQGGRYGVTVIGSTFGTVTLQKAGGDATPTFAAAMTAFSANGFATQDLPPGDYKIALA